MYLEKGLSIQKMFKFYQEWADDKEIHITATERQYRDIFNLEFNIAFHKPKKDQCDLYNAYNIATEQIKSNLQLNYDNHQNNKDVAWSLKNADKELTLNDKTVLVVCFDLQKVLITPMSEASVFYCKSKYATYNFTIYGVGNNSGF
ncbi:dna-directed rna polymerases i ii and iii subunit rpabc2 [Holotrichia oblita]|uniref:Dna-directed rna polymerases i ii and iii subunit rpabc2 n=1 Tax=Holotrichia oblita TaxID=644536 RepID=A0ACB9SRW8_HOLOL|nr:dna-directed rna polymerases i ii and iii subunit rpabc2 [Holotrichia oblita]